MNPYEIRVTSKIIFLYHNYLIMPIEQFHPTYIYIYITMANLMIGCDCYNNIINSYKIKI